MLYAKVDEKGRVRQESAYDPSGEGGPLTVDEMVSVKSLGYVPVLAVRAEGVAEIRKRIVGCDKYKALTSGVAIAAATEVDALRWALRALGLPEQEEP